MTMSEDTTGRVLAGIYELHRHRDAASFAARLLGVPARVVACARAVMATVEPASGAFRLETWPGGQFERLDRPEVIRLHAAEHPFVTHCRRSRSVRAFRLCDLATRESFLATALYANLYRFLGIEHQLLMLAASAGSRWRVLALNRRAHEFSEEDRAALESLWPHIT